MNKKYKIYNNGQKDIRVYEDEVVPEGFVLGTHYKRIPWNKGLDKSDPRVAKNGENTKQARLKNNSYQAWNKGLTIEDSRVKKNIDNTRKTIKEKYGVENISQYLSQQENYSIWNKGLTKENNESVNQISLSKLGKSTWNKGKTHLTDNRIICRNRTEEEKRHLKEINSSTEVKTKRFSTMMNNNTLFVGSNSSKELKLYSDLVNTYGKDDIIRQYYDKERYPYKCDFYIKSLDQFIEVNAHWTHGKEPFDEKNENHIQILNEWKEKAKTSKFYKNAIYVWTDLDVRKQKCAKENNLNYKVIY